MKQAIILAAGEGQRLRPFTVQRPKSMITIADKPILQFVIESLAENGIRNIVLVVGYRKEQVYDYFGSGEKLGVNITYVTQETQIGTAHALSCAEEVAESEFLVLAADNLITPKTIAEFVEAPAQSVLTRRVSTPGRYGVVLVENGKVSSVVEKPREAGTNMVNIGIYSFNKDIFEFIGTELDIPDVLNKMIEKGHSLNAVETSGLWLDVVYPWDILSLNGAVLDGIEPNLGGTMERNVTIKGNVSIGRDTIIRSNCYIMGPAVIGNGCDIGPDVCIYPATSIGGNVVISAFTDVRNSVIGSDLSIGSGSLLHDSVIARGCVIKPRFTACTGRAEIVTTEGCHTVNVGAMMGEGCSIENSVSASPGVIVGNYCHVNPMKQISGRLPDRSLVY